MSVLSVFVGAILPVLALAGIGYLLAVRRNVAVGPLNAVTVYVLAPALVFHTLATTEMSGAVVAKVAAGVVVLTFTMALVADAAGRALGEEEPTLSALVLAATFQNTGNYGLPVAAFAFGVAGRETAVLFLTAQSVLIYTLGVYLAARSGGRAGTAGVRQVFYTPLVYAAVAGLVLRAGGWVPTGNVMDTVALTGDAAIPLLQIVLGAQLARTEFGSVRSAAVLPTLFRFGVAPLLGVALAVLLDFGDPAVARVFVLEAAMPVAVTPVLLITEFGGDGIEGPGYVSAATLVTTLVSVPFLSALIVALQSGWLV